MDSGRRFCPGSSETKDFITHSTAGGMSLVPASVPVAPKAQGGDVQWLR